MIDKELRHKIEKELGEQEHIDSYFRECYRMMHDGKTYIVLSPHVTNHGDCTMIFDEETGEYAGLEQWSYAQQEGELL